MEQTVQILGLQYIVHMSAMQQLVNLVSTSIRPIRLVLYRGEVKFCDFKQSASEKMIEVNLFQPTRMKTALPIIFTWKNNVTIRFQINYRDLNAIIINDLYPSPRLD